MLRGVPKSSAKDTTKYFFGYYAEEMQEPAKWQGKGAEKLALNGIVKEEDFNAILNNQNPITGKQITARNAPNRTPAFEFELSVPKSVSLAYVMVSTEEKIKILEAYSNAREKMMELMENRAETRVRKNGVYENRVTGNLIYSTYTHGDSRPVDGITDPQLHSHIIIANATYDEKEEKWKAVNFRNLKADAPFFEAAFNAEYAIELQKIGYEVERNSISFELSGFTPELIEKYSNRKKQIEEEAKKLGIVYAEDKAALGAKTREHKIKGMDLQKKIKEWKARATEHELTLMINPNKTTSIKKEISATEALDYAIETELSKKSTVYENDLLRTALKRSTTSVSIDHLKAEMDKRNDLKSMYDKGKNQKIYTSDFALAEEEKLKVAARNGKGILNPTNENYIVKNPLMDKGQKEAVKHGLTSKDFITIIAGGAGTGKTWSIKEIAEGAKEAGISFHAFAPTSRASKGVQREEGFAEATTLDTLFLNKRMQEKMKDSIIWLDEAGQVGNRSMNKLIDIAKEQNARILLTGDTKQHTAVERGDSLRILQKYGNIEPYKITKIQRQRIHVTEEDFTLTDRQRVDKYRSVVKDLSEGSVTKAYQNLDKMGAIFEMDDINAVAEKVAENYVNAIERKKKVVLFTPTHSQGKLATAQIREKLKEKGYLNKQDRNYTIAKNMGLDEPEKKDPINYQEGQQIQFHIASKGIKKGDKFDVVKATKEGVVIKSDKNAKHLIPFSESHKFALYQKHEITLAKGDLIKATKNATTKDGKRLDNGTYLKVKDFKKNGDIIVSTGKREMVLEKGHSNLTHGYYSTSHSGQGLSAQEVIVMQTKASGKASSKEQFYVSVSRGKFNIAVYTDDKSNLLQSVQKSTQRMTAMEIVRAKNEPDKGLAAIKDKLKTFGLIYKKAQSRVASVGEKVKSSPIINLITQPQKTVPNATRARIIK
jgi:conjugative relaxase-like TrwC/TraI family protein